MGSPVVAVILAGGTGTRLYPASRPDNPKQFHRLGGNRSLLQETVTRLEVPDEIYVLTGEHHTDRVREQVPSAGLLVEPRAKDTGPACVYAAHRLREQLGDCVMVCLPSDHYIAGNLSGTLEGAVTTATKTNGLVTIGIEPDRPATGFGYIRPGGEVNGAHRVVEFVEKPDERRARELISRGAYWNAGMFAWTPRALLRAARTTPLSEFVERLETDTTEAAFEQAPAVSVDGAILERAEDRYVVPGTFEWDDLGTWDAIGRVREHDDAGNVWLSDGLAIDATDCVVAGDGHVSLVGVDGLVVASYGGRTLVVPRDRSERVREVVDELGSMFTPDE